LMPGENDGTSGPNLERLRAAAARHKVRLISVRPAWCEALISAARAEADWASAAHTALAVVEGRSLSWLVLARGAVVAVRQRYLDPHDSENPRTLATLLDELATETPEPVAPARRRGWGDASAGLVSAGAGLQWLLGPTPGAPA